MLRKNRLVGVNYLDIEDMALLTFSPVRFTNRGDYVSIDANRALACIKPSLWMVFKAPWVAHPKKRKTLVDERTRAGDDPFEVQAVGSQYLHYSVDIRFQLHKKSNQ